MSTFTSPVSLSEFKSYLKDTTTDVPILAFYQSLLDMATEKIYIYLGRDYTPGAVKTDVFFGKGFHIHRMQHPSGTLTSWKYYDEAGAETVADIADLTLLAEGKLVVSANKTFKFGFEHRLRYSLPVTLTCPETVKQAILETAALIYEESKLGGGRLGLVTESATFDTNIERYHYLDLTKRQITMLAPYKRYAI